MASKVFAPFALLMALLSVEAHAGLTAPDLAQSTVAPPATASAPVPVGPTDAALAVAPTPGPTATPDLFATPAPRPNSTLLEVGIRADGTMLVAGFKAKDVELQGRLHQAYLKDPFLHAVLNVDLNAPKAAIVRMIDALTLEGITDVDMRPTLVADTAAAPAAPPMSATDEGIAPERLVDQQAAERYEGALRAELKGKLPEACRLAEEGLALAPTGRYEPILKRLVDRLASETNGHRDSRRRGAEASASACAGPRPGS